MTTSINIDLDAIFHHITTKESLFIFRFHYCPVKVDK